jgi:peptidoglycan DL-endopeptidase CwlO
MRLPRTRKFRALVVAALSSSLVLGLGFAPIEAKTRKPTIAEIEAAKKAEIAKKAAAAAAQKKLNEANERLRQLTAKAEIAQAAHNRAVVELGKKQSVLNVAVSRQQAALNTLRTQKETIGKIAASAYRMGAGFGNIDSLLSSDGPQDLIDRLSTLGVLGANNDVLLQRFAAAEADARAAKAAADKARQEQAAATAQVAAARRDADAIRAGQKKEVEELLAVQDALLKQLATARNVRVSLEQQRQLAILEELAARRATTTKGQPKVWGLTGFDGRLTVRASANQRAKAVEFAKREVQAGKPYVWGDEGPNAYDCSGLVYQAYRYAGLQWNEWSRLNSRLYFASTKRIPVNQVVPGDLLFWSYDGTPSGIHHMAIYAGDGMVWEARNTKVGLKFSSIYSMPGLMPEAGRV